jgi:hypothetical protein
MMLLVAGFKGQASEAAEAVRPRMPSNKILPAFASFQKKAVKRCGVLLHGNWTYKKEPRI